MDGDRFQEEAVLAAVKPLKALESTPSQAPSDAGPSNTSPFQMPIESAQTMTRGGLETLFREHHDRVFRAAHRVTGSAADAEDVLQTVFLRLVRAKEGAQQRSAQTFEWSENPAAYLSRAAINASLDLIRKRKRVKAVAMDDVENAASTAKLGTKRNPESHQEDRELRKLIREAVARLGERAGAMFALRYFEGYDNGEIARIMGTSALVVGVTLHRARARLRKEIGTYLGTHGEKGDLSA